MVRRNPNRDSPTPQGRMSGADTPPGDPGERTPHDSPDESEADARDEVLFSVRLPAMFSSAAALAALRTRFAASPGRRDWATYAGFSDMLDAALAPTNVTVDAPSGDLTASVALGLGVPDDVLRDLRRGDIPVSMLEPRVVVRLARALGLESHQFETLARRDLDRARAAGAGGPAPLGAEELTEPEFVRAFLDGCRAWWPPDPEGGEP